MVTLFLKKMKARGGGGGVTKEGFLFHYAYILSFINQPESKNSLFVISKWEDMIMFYPNMIYF